MRRRAQLLSKANRVAHLTRCKLLLKRFPEHATVFIWFSDKKSFHGFNAQNDRAYAPTRTKKRDIAPSRLLRTQSTFSKSLMVSVAVSKMGVVELIFVDSGVKVNRQSYWDVLLSQKMLPVINNVAGDTVVFQQNSAPAHYARETIQLLKRETSTFIGPELWPLNRPEPVDSKIRGLCNNVCMTSKLTMSTS